ncbi:KilA-N domain-containing protein [Candidatus Thiothrix sp. Deng01]|uniref:KilA-N domain-containing protein n=1 Tax=Candidatus Thiothrix phosphatis TaxID=3112415 RepID=A0ABU6CUE2_9GAMM|nr:KilA-N domain-containing protein [Candidatus Thiothrix sp. Deng01]MEB4590132.1 KilA-N domain-containing protein [Candidatus Thiothrix sp. Deng01]
MPPLSVCDTNISIRENRYSLNDLHKASGGERKHQPSNFLRVEQTQELIAEIDKSSDVRISHEVIRGKNGGTFVCKELMYAYAMWISARVHLAVIRGFDAMVNEQRQPETAAAPAAPALEHKPLTEAGGVALLHGPAHPRPLGRAGTGHRRPEAWWGLNGLVRWQWTILDRQAKLEM